MKELTSPTAVSPMFHLDTARNAADSKVWSVLRGAPRASEGVTKIEAGSIIVHGLPGLGRAMQGSNGDLILEPTCIRRDAFLNRVAAIVADFVPYHCPFCAGQELRHVTTETWNKEVEEDKERPESADFDEYQCHGTCQGRSFFV